LPLTKNAIAPTDANSVTIIGFLQYASIVLYIKIASASKLFYDEAFPFEASNDLDKMIIAFAFETLAFSRSPY
jgi:hypothetical protein